MPSLDFFIGKGGVGKTTVSSAYAVLRAARGDGRVLLLSTDPAHSLFDVFALRSSRERQRVRLGGRRSLDVWQLDAAREFGEFLDEYREAVLDVIASGTIFSREEVAPLLQTTIPGMAEVSALLVLAGLLGSREYDCIVVDTAPLGHTLRLFELPDSFLKLLRFLQVAASRDRLLAQRFAHADLAAPPFLKDWQRRAAAIRDALAGPNSRIVLVTSPEEFSLNESVRAQRALAESSPPLRVSEIVLNRALSGGGKCPRCLAAARRTEAARSFLRRNFRGAWVHLAADAGAPIAGTAPLLAFGEHVFEGRKLRLDFQLPKLPRIPFLPDEWPVLSTPLSLTIGKGGVGKTTMSAALGMVSRRERPAVPVTICSTDPAPSLDDVFRQPVTEERAPVLRDPDFFAMELDAAADFRRWTARVKDKLAGAFGGSSGRVHVDLSFEREVISALLDMVPPGMDELAATFRMLDLLRGEERVIIDMAPTGHALELLRMPERIQLWTRLLLRALAPHRALSLAQEAAVEIATIGQEVRRLSRTLHDPKLCRTFVVMLPEPLPDRETGRLIDHLGDLDIARGPVFVNRVLPTDGLRCPRCAQRARFQASTLARLRRLEFGTLLAVPEQPAPVAGAMALRRLTRGVWRIEQ